MSSSYRISRPSVIVPIAAGATTGNTVVASLKVNGLLRGIIISPSAFDTTNVSVSDSVTTAERLDIARAGTRDLKVNDLVTTVENMVGVRA